MNKKCIICNNEYKLFKTDFINRIYYCSNCNFFEAEILDKAAKKINYNKLLNSVSYLRIINFQKILNKIEKYFKFKPYGLEVGCSTGIFMQLAQERKFEMIGIEPMHSSFDIAKRKKLIVVNEYFSKDFFYDKKFDFIIFNDVFEHLPKINEIIDKCKELLKDNGLLIINLPVSEGILYKVAKIFNFFWISTFFKRLWQFDTESPHLYYFNSKNLRTLLSRNNFSFIFQIHQKTFVIKGLFERINSSVKIGAVSLIIFILLILFIPIMAILPKDTNCLIFRKLS